MKNKITMQAFHARLFQPTEVFDPNAEALAQLTQMSPNQIGALSSSLDWGVWTAVPDGVNRDKSDKESNKDT
jgi:hypothetical protein